MGAPAEIQRVIEYIDAHLDEEISTSLLGEIAGYSPWHLCHLFTDHIGTPVMEYVRSRRRTTAGCLPPAASVGAHQRIGALAFPGGMDNNGSRRKREWVVLSWRA